MPEIQGEKRHAVYNKGGGEINHIVIKIVEMKKQQLRKKYVVVAQQIVQGEAVYCDYCEMWLNSPTQWEDHIIGIKHKKNIGGPRSSRPTTTGWT